MNMSVSQGQYPSKLKHAKVIPIYKGEDKSPGNYRPISLLSNFNRIFEKVMFKRLKAFLDHEIQLKITDGSTGTPFLLAHKEYVKYLGVLIDSHLSWKYHIDYVASKVSKIVGVIARLRHFVPVATLRSIYQSLIIPYLSYGLAVWGQAAKSQLNKLLLLQKRVTCTDDVFLKTHNSCYSFFYLFENITHTNALL